MSRQPTEHVWHRNYPEGRKYCKFCGIDYEYYMVLIEHADLLDYDCQQVMAHREARYNDM